MNPFLFSILGLGIFLPSSPAFEKRSVDLSTGISMKYVDAGNPDGEAVILLHGITDSSRSFYPTMEHLAALRPDLRLIALDQRGHGETSLPKAANCRKAPEECFRPADFAADVLAFMDALGIERAHLVGHSMGTAIAQIVALERAERVSRLVLIAGFASMVDGPVLRDFLLGDRAEGAWKDDFLRKGLRFPEDVYELAPLDADPEAEKWMLQNWVTDPTADPEYLAAIARETARVPLGAWLGAARAFLSFDNREPLSELTVPTLVLWPTQDNVVPRSPYQNDLLASLDRAAASCRTSYVFKQYGARPLPSSGLQEDDFGHNLQWGPSREVALDLASWLRDGGQPTKDHYFADPGNPRRVITKTGEAILTEGPAKSCPATQK
jgi:pimeloyl-ACP methyl ester carboxylesterase